ncbi:MAG: hypothetical protein EZS28_031956, partial [Streblomastix strix]
GLVTSETFNDQLLDKADKTDLDNYVTLGTAQSINANKTFNNPCRFTSTIDGMSTITGQSFIKSGGTDQQLLLANGSTKPLSDFIDSIDIQYFVDKSTDQTIGGNKVFSLEVRAPTFILPGYSSDYVVMSGAMKNKSHFVLTDDVDQTVTGSKTFSNNVTAPAFIKSDGTDQQVLLANGSTKPLSEFSGGSVDDSNYVKKTGQTLQVIKGYLRKNMQDLDGDEPSEEDEDYITKGEVANQYVSLGGNQQIIGTKSFYDSVTANGFIKKNGTNQQVLLANGSTKPLSEFSGGGGDMTNYVQKIGADVQIINGILRRGEDDGEESEDDDDYITKGVYNNATNNIINSQCVRKTGQTTQNVNGRLLYINPFGIEDDDSQLLTDTTYPTWREISNTITSKFYNFYQVMTPPVMQSGFTASQSSRDICTVNPPPLYTIFRILNSDYLAMFTDDGTVHFTTQGTVWTIYLDEALLDAAGLSDFPELYAYIRERYQEPVPPAQAIPIGEQTLQKQVKDNDDILNNSNEEFIPPVSNAPTKLDLSSQLERSSFLASSGSDPQLIVYGDRVTLTASYETTGLFPNGYLFKSYPEEARPKAGDKVIALVGTDTTNKNSIFCYIDQNGPFIISISQIPSKTGLFINVTYYKKYEQSKIINYDANNDGIVNMMDTWHVNGKGTFETQSHVYDTVKKQTDLIATGLFGDNKVNYLNSDIKLEDELAIYKADRAAFFIKEGPFITFSFGATLGQIIQQQENSENRQTVHRLFSTITQKLLPPNTKYIPVRTEQQEYAAMCLFKDIYDKSLAVEVAVSGILNTKECEFQGTYILDNYKNPTSNEEVNEVPNASPLNPKEPDSHIDEVIIKHDGKLAQSQQIFTITNVFNQIQLYAPFNQGGHALNTYYIVDDGTCKVCVFNLYFESKGMETKEQEIGLLPDSVLPTDGKSMGFPASVYRNAGGYINWW